MKRTAQFFRTIELITLLFLLSVVSAFAGTTTKSNKGPAPENVILRWNRVLQETIRTPGMQPPTIFPVRSFAMMHGAMFDAVNSIDRTHTAYLIDVPANPRASQEAAAAKAARDVLVALYPGRQMTFDEELAISIEGVPWTTLWPATIVGQAAAARMLEVRANDGWNTPPPP